MNFKLLKNKEKLKINTVKSNTNDNERTREKFILKEWIESSRKTTCTKNGTRDFLFGSQTPSKMDFSLGRSMVEMLGVLAIIGVLSIGGIAGYTMAMRRYRANEILNVATKYALILYSNCQNAMMNDNSSYYIEGEGYNAGGATWYCPKYIPFTNAGLGGLPSGVTQIAVSKMNSDTNLFDDVYIVSTNSGDYVGLRVTFDSKELCQTASTMVGKEELYTYDWNPKPCDDNLLIFSVPVN